MSLPASLRAWLGAFATRPRFLALAAFLFAGDLKADPRLAWLPVDLTLATGALLAGVLAVRFLRGARLPSLEGPALLGAWFLSFVPGLFRAADSPYAFQKVAAIYTFTLLSALAPLFLLEDDADRVRLVNAMAWFCLAMTLGGLLGDAPDAQRLRAFGAGTIALGRAAGLLFTLAAIALAGEAPLPLLSFGIMALAGVAAAFSGSRGPMVAALAALALLFGTRPGRGALRLLAATGAFLALLGACLPLAPRGSLVRVEAFLHGQYGASEGYRVEALRDSWRLVGDAPWGIGWGGFAVQVDPERGVGRQYPHNILAETTLESGWLCGATTLLVLAAALAAGWARTRRPGGRVVFAGTVFYLVNALVSGDLNDNRPLFMFVGAALMAWGGAVNGPRMAVVTTAHAWGDPRVFERELAACLEWGVEAHVFVPLAGPPPRSAWSAEPGLVVHPLPVPGSRAARVRLALGVWRRVLRHGPFRLVHFHDPELVPAMALLAILCPDTYTLFDIHEDLPLQVASKSYLRPGLRGPTARLAECMLRAARELFSGFAPATEAIARAWPAGRTRVLHNYPKALFGLAGELGRPLDPRRILYVGGLSRVRGIPLALEAVALARRRLPDLRLELIGPVMEPEVGRAVRAAAAEGWCAHTPWLGPEALLAQAAGAGVGLATLLPVPSYLESLPTKLFEYMAMGIPVLASDFPLWRRLVEASGAGRLAVPSPEPVARALVELCSDPEALRRHSRAGRSAYLERYRWEAEARNLRWHLRRAQCA